MSYHSDRIIDAVRGRIMSKGGEYHSRQVAGAVEVLAEEIAALAAALPAPPQEPVAGRYEGSMDGEGELHTWPACESCGKPATIEDPNGTRLCDDCAEPLLVQRAAKDAMAESVARAAEEPAPSHYAEDDEPSFVRTDRSYVEPGAAEAPPEERGEPAGLVAHVYTPGDPSVGLEGQCVTVTGIPDFDDDEQRENARRALAQAFGVALGDSAEVAFSDDLPEDEAPAAALNGEADGDLFRQYTALLGELLGVFGLRGDIPEAGNELLRRVRELVAPLAGRESEPFGVKSSEGTGQRFWFVVAWTGEGLGARWVSKHAAEEEAGRLNRLFAARSAPAAPPAPEGAEPAAWLYVCPSCGLSDGYCVSDATLLCPNCSERLTSEEGYVMQNRGPLYLAAPPPAAPDERLREAVRAMFHMDLRNHEGVCTGCGATRAQPHHDECPWVRLRAALDAAPPQAAPAGPWEARRNPRPAPAPGEERGWTPWQVFRPAHGIFPEAVLCGCWWEGAALKIVAALNREVGDAAPPGGAVGAEDLLRRCEFVYDSQDGEKYCPLCENHEDAGHEESCVLGQFIAARPSAAPPPAMSEEPRLAWSQIERIVRTAVEEFRCQHTRDEVEGDGLGLVDALSHGESIREGKEEVESLLDAILGELVSLWPDVRAAELAALEPEVPEVQR